MKVAIFGGSFDPVHEEHVRYVEAAIEQLNLDRVIVMPTKIAPHKLGGAHVSGEDRLEMCKIAFRGVSRVEVSDLELKQEGTSYSYLTCREFACRYPNDERFFLIGADMLEDFFSWKNPNDILKNVTLVACCRGKQTIENTLLRFEEVFGKSCLKVNFTGKEVSSTCIRVELAFEKKPIGLDNEVYRYICERKLYEYLCIPAALALEKEARRDHTLRVAKMACKRASSLGMPEEKALLAAALHDCAKYILPDSPLLDGLCIPSDVPLAVVHQYSGAFLAKNKFGITDDEILNAIRYHTSGRSGMGNLEKLIFLSDMLEEGREFPGIQPLREAFWRDLDECLYLCLKHQINYLKNSNAPIYALTEQAYAWICGVIK